MNYQTINVSKAERVVTIELNRPEAANGLNLAMASELHQAALECSNDADVKAVILTAQGRFFCAGGDLNAMLQHSVSAGAGVSEIAEQLHCALSVFARMDAPLITAINGTAAGAGFSIAVAGDIAIAAQSAKFTMAYTNVGLSPDGSSSYVLPRLIGLRRTQELMLTNRVLSATQAEQWGAITQVVADEELSNTATTLAKQFAKGAQGSVAKVKSLLLTSYQNDLETQMAQETQGIVQSANSSDGQEGINAFLEKRQAVYS